MNSVSFFGVLGIVYVVRLYYGCGDLRRGIDGELQLGLLSELSR